jgi:hypothetical protein
MRKLAFLLIFAASLMAQISDAPTGRSHPLVLTAATNAGAHSASTVFTAPVTGYYLVHWSLRTTTAGSAGTITALTFAWNNGNAMSRNALLVGPQILDLASLVSVGLTSAEITGTQPMFVTSGTAVTWATTVGISIVGSPNYTAEFRVVALN